MNDVIDIVINDKREITIDGSTYKVDENIKSIAKKLLRIYCILIAIFVVIGINVAPMIGSSSFFSDILFIILLLCLLTFNFNFIVKAIFKKVV